MTAKIFWEDYKMQISSEIRQAQNHFFIWVFFWQLAEELSLQFASYSTLFRALEKFQFIHRRPLPRIPVSSQSSYRMNVGYKVLKSKQATRSWVWWTRYGNGIRKFFFLFYLSLAVAAKTIMNGLIYSHCFQFIAFYCIFFCFT